MLGQPDMFSLPVNQLHRPGQETSKTALEKSVVSRSNRQERVYKKLVTYGFGGAIPEEVAKAMDEELIDVRRCFSVLKKLDKIEATGATKFNGKGNECEMWRVKP